MEYKSGKFNFQFFIKTHFAIVILVLIALSIRSWTILYGTNVDEGDYLLQGRELAKGLWPYLDVHLNKPPLVTILGYPFFLFTQIPIIPIRIFMILISASSILAMWLLGREWIDERAGIAAAAFLAFDPYSAIWAKYLHVSTLAPTLSIWTIYFLSHGLRKDKQWPILTAGIISSLSLLNKQTGILIFPVVILLFLLFCRRQKLIPSVLYFFAGFSPLLLALILWLFIMNGWDSFLYNIYYGNLAMAGFFHQTLLDRWREFHATAFFNPIAWYFVIPGLLTVFVYSWKIGAIIVLWFTLEMGINLFALSHVWQHYMLAITPPAFLLSGIFIGWFITLLQQKVIKLSFSPVIILLVVLVCSLPFWRRANWTYPNITLEDEKAFAAFIDRNCSTKYLLCFVNTTYYIRTGKDVPPSIRDGHQERIPPFMNTAGRKYLTLADMQKTVALWETLPMDFCLMYPKYYHQIFIEQDPHLQPVRIFLEEQFIQTQDFKTKPTYYAHMICFKRKDN